MVDHRSADLIAILVNVEFVLNEFRIYKLYNIVIFYCFFLIKMF